MIRPARDDDAAGFIDLIGSCWAEYPGCVLDVEAEAPELRALATYFRDLGGMLWAMEREGRVIGMIGTRPLKEDQAWEICRMYLDGGARGGGLASRLLDTAEAHARAAGAVRMVLWTDTRFTRAHGFYEKHGYVRHGSIRILDDLSHSLEFRYAKPARGLVVEALDAAAAASAERRLAALLVACVADGASLEFLPPLPRERAIAFWKSTSAAVAAGTRVLLVAWRRRRAGRHRHAGSRHRREPAARRRHPEAAGGSGPAPRGDRPRADAPGGAGGARPCPAHRHARYTRRQRGGGALPRRILAGTRPHPGLRA